MPKLPLSDLGRSIGSLMVATALASMIGCSSLTTSGPPVSATASTHTTQSSLVYAVEEYNFSVTAYPESANGDVSPAVTIVGGQTRLYEPPGLAVSPAGIAAVSNSNGAITEYAPGANGNVAPIATITCGGPPNFPGQPHELAFDSHGNLYVNYSLYHGAPSEAIEIYKPKQQTGCVNGQHILFGSKTGITASGGITVANGLIYTADGSTIRVFRAKDNGDVKPHFQIQGPKTGLENADGISLDRQGNIYVANGSDIRVFRPNAKGNSAPSAVISGSNTQIPTDGGATGIALSRTGNIFVAVQNDSTNSILVFASGAHGNVAPIQTISGSATGLGIVAELALLEPSD